MTLIDAFLKDDNFWSCRISDGPKTNSRSKVTDRVLYHVQNEGNESINIINIIIINYYNYYTFLMCLPKAECTKDTLPLLPLCSPTKNRHMQWILESQFQGEHYAPWLRQAGALGRATVECLASYLQWSKAQFEKELVTKSILSIRLRNQ